MTLLSMNDDRYFLENYMYICEIVMHNNVIESYFTCIIFDIMCIEFIVQIHKTTEKQYKYLLL